MNLLTNITLLMGVSRGELELEYNDMRGDGPQYAEEPLVKKEPEKPLKNKYPSNREYEDALNSYKNNMQAFKNYKAYKRLHEEALLSLIQDSMNASSWDLDVDEDSSKETLASAVYKAPMQRKINIDLLKDWKVQVFKQIETIGDNDVRDVRDVKNW